MFKSLLRLSLAATALAAVSTAAMSADIEAPPPPEELRPATYDWTGPYIGVFGGGLFVDSFYDAREFCEPPGSCDRDPEMDGASFVGGVLGGWNYDMDGFVFGIEGDWGWGTENSAENNDPAEKTEFNIENLATIRARAGFTSGDTLFYATGGVAFADTEFGGEITPVGLNASDDKWLTGWTIGGGIEHAFSSGFHGRLEYLYMDFPQETYTLVAGGVGGEVDLQFDSVHMFRAALTYNFTW